jgi:HSP20 family protein
MSSLMRWDPFREIMRLRQDMDRQFGQLFGLPQTGSATGNGNSLWSSTDEYPLAVDVADNENEFIVYASIPGINPENIDITLTNNVLTIRGEMQPQQLPEGTQFHLRERVHGRFVRSLILPVPVQDDQVEANYEYGLLTLRVPKSEQAKPKRIPIKNPQMIEG